MPVYKFLRTSDVDRVLVDGTVRISSLEHFRRLEASRQWIADRDEGSARLEIQNLSVTGGPGDAIAAATPPGSVPLVSMAPGVTAQFENISFQWACPNVHIYSASRGEYRDHHKSMGTDGYDACLEIRDIDLLAHRLLHRGHIRELANARMRNCFARCEIADVTYEAMVRPPGAGRLPAPSPFRKDRAFAAQLEVRIAFWPVPNVTVPPVVTVVLDQGGDIFARVYRGDSSLALARMTKAEARRSRRNAKRAARDQE